MRDKSFVYGAIVPWGRRPQDTQWQEISIWAMEHFGLPGNKYVVDINVNDMTWWFRDPQDRLIFQLRNGSAQCVGLITHD